MMAKFCSTLRIAITLVLARTFGEYVHSGWNGYHQYARYRWRGNDWCVPTGPMEDTK